MQLSKKKIVLISGAAGMVGSNLIKRFIKKKNIIILALDNLTLGKIDYLNQFIKKKNFFFFKKDLSKNFKDKKLHDILNNNKLSEVWLLAANSDIRKGSQDSKVDFENTYLTNFTFLKFLRIYLDKDAKIIFSSSSAIYGRYKGIINEKLKKYKPISNYGKMKLLSEKFINKFCTKNKLKGFIFRFPNVVGKNLTHGVIYDLNKKIKTKSNYLKVLGNGNQTKPYSDVEEIISCLIFFTRIKFSGSINYFNIGNSDDGIKVKEIVKILLKKKKSRKIPIYQRTKYGWKGDVPFYKYSTKKINNLGFKFKLSSKQSVIKAIDNLK